MIVDCHAHVFQDWGGPAGHPSASIHLKYLQRGFAHPVATKAFRARDGKQMRLRVLARPDDNTWAGLTDVNFRVGRHGQLVYTWEGDDYYFQYMPVGMQKIACPPDFLIAQMIYAEVDHCILQAGGGYGAMNDYNAFAQSQHPQRFSGLLHIDEGIADRPEQLAEVDRAVGRLGLKGLYYSHNMSRHGFDRNLDHKDFAPFWEKIAGYKLPVFLEMSSTPNYDRASYLGNLQALDALLQRHPSSRFLFVMGPSVGHFAPKGSWEFPEEALKVYKRDNLQLEVMFPITWGGTWDYPYPEAQKLIREMRDLFGASKLLWGSDMPNVERFCTYRQCVDYVRKHCTFLSAAEKELILGGNAAELIGLKH
ncbi:MAG: amidohydrolase [Proteobacteria bacterium]|nr:amidohydrolase [Pseudomonadota bacterium]MBI3495987.1 amidohydrolase [Pseudomonadota bacterium]